MRPKGVATGVSLWSEGTTNQAANAATEKNKVV